MTVPIGRSTVSSFEIKHKVGKIAKTALIADLGDGKRRIFQQFFGKRKLQIHHIAFKGYSRIRLEFVTEIIRGIIHLLCYLLKINTLFKMTLNIQRAYCIAVVLTAGSFAQHRALILPSKEFNIAER